MADYYGTAVVLVGVKETPWQCGYGIGGERAQQACERDLAEETWTTLDLFWSAPEEYLFLTRLICSMANS